MSIGVDNRTGPWPSLVVRDVRRLLAMRASGATGPEIARALDISERTVRRYCRGRVVQVMVDDWRMAFLVRPGKPPVILERLHIR